MKVAVIGAGAIGSLLAGYLVDQGEEAVLIARPEQCAAICRDGLTIEGARGRLLVDLTVKEQLDQPVDLVILATKTQDLEQAIAQNLTYLKDRHLLTIQNGVRAEEVIAKRLNPARDNLFASIVMFGATYLAPGRVVHNFEGNWILGGINLRGQDAIVEIKQLAEKIFPASVSDQIMAMKWLKLFLNANNCLPALLDKSMQQTFRSLSICKISLRIWQEGWTLVNKAKIKLASLPNFPLERLNKLISMPQEQSAQIFSQIMTGLSKEPLYGSILQSIKRGRPSEIDYINGEFVHLAQRIGAKAPLNEKLTDLVHNVEQSKQFLSEEELLERVK